MVSPRLTLLVSVVPHDIHAMSGKDEARDPRLLVDVDCEGPHSLGDVGDQARRRSLGSQLLVEDHIPFQHGRLDPAFLDVLERGERAGRNVLLHLADGLDHVGLENLLFLEVPHGDENLLSLFLGRSRLAHQPTGREHGPQAQNDRKNQNQQRSAVHQPNSLSVRSGPRRRSWRAPACSRSTRRHGFRRAAPSIRSSRSSRWRSGCRREGASWFSCARQPAPPVRRGCES